MKKKSLALLITSITGLALAGGTFAAWAVTDNAAPFSINVTPGEVSTDTTDYVTLEWGSQKNIGNVSNLQAGETRKVGVLDLRVNTESTAALSGKLSQSIAYSGEGATYKLSTQLSIKVYAGDLTLEQAAAATPVDMSAGYIDIVTTPDTYSGQTLVPGNRNKAILYSVFASLPDMTASDYAQYKTQSATITYDWGVAAGTQEVSGDYTTYYAAGFGSTVYAYAWKNGAENATWPGVKMEAANVNGFYSVQIEDAKQYTKIIFSDGTDNKKSEDIVIAESFVNGKNCYTYNGGDNRFTVHDDSVEVAYYLVGEHLFFGDNSSAPAAAWSVDQSPSQAKLTLVSGVANINVYTDGNAKLKVYEVASGIWYSNDGNDFTLNDAGKYTITFTLNGTSPLGAAQRA